MKVCLFTLEWPPYGCGIGTYMYNLARGLVAEGHQVTIITHDRNPLSVEHVRIINVQVIDFRPGLWLRIQKWRMEPFQSWSKLAYEVFNSLVCNGEEFDIVETAEYGAWGRHLIGASLPLVVRCHTPTSLLQSSTLPQALPLWLWIQDQRERALANGADGIVCPSKALAAWIIEKWDISAERIRVIPNPIDDRLFQSKAADGTNNSELLFVGRLEERKGVFDFAEAVLPLLECYPQLTVRYVGLDMPAPKELAKLGATASQVIESRLPEKIRDRVKFTGHIPIAEIIGYWQGALCAVVPSRVLESFSYTVLEAMACGCPVIATRRGGPSEIISHEVDGLLFEPGDVRCLQAEIERLVKYPMLRSKLSGNARKTVESRYGIHVVTREIIEFYSSVIDAKNYAKRNSK